jgi:hypothetical protein
MSQGDEPWQSIIYPGLIVNKTFIDVKLDKPLSIAEFYKEREVRSAPGSRLASSSSEMSRTYCPGQVLTETAHLSFASGCDAVALPSIVENHEVESDSGVSWVPVQPTTSLGPTGKDEASESVSEEPAEDSYRAARLLLQGMAGNVAATSTDVAAPPAEAEDGSHPVQLRLQDAFVEPEVDAPTIGSRSHRLGTCQPCAFVYKEEGCKAGAECKFCHLCGPDARKQRKKEKQQVVRNLRQQRREGASWSGSTGDT